MFSYPRLSVLRSLESFSPYTREYRPWSHEPDLSYSVKVPRILHSAHQGVSSMESRARSIVFWPGITNDIWAVREHCSACNRSSCSNQPRPQSPRQSPQPRSNQYSQTFFYFGGCHYFVAGDRLSRWVEIFKAPHGTAQAGAQGLIAALGALFATFGVPEEISNNGDPDFSSAATADFLTRLKVRHCMSSAYFPCQTVVQKWR